MLNNAIVKIYQDALFAVCWPKRKVYVRGRRPYPPDASGCISITKNGIIVMDIDPNLDMENAYKIFLHELGHVVCGHGEGLKPSDWMYRAPGTGPNELNTPERVAAHRAQPDEQAADEYKRVCDERISAKRDQLFKPGTGPQIYQKYFILQHYATEVLS